MYAKAKRDNEKIPEFKVIVNKNILVDKNATMKKQGSTIMDGPERQGVMDELFESMKSGDAFKTTQKRRYQVLLYQGAQP